MVIAGDTLDTVIQQHVENGLQKEQLLRQISFARQVQATNDDGPDHFTLAPCPAGNAPRWDGAEERFATPELLEQVRTAFQAGRLISFKIPVHVRREDGSLDKHTSFRVHLQRSVEPHPAIETFLREGLTISGQHFMREPGVVAVVMPEDSPNNALGTLLGDAENPAHTRWERGGKHFKGRYRHGPSILSFIQRSAQHLTALLSRRPEGRDPELLKNLFHVPEPGAASGQTPKPGDGRKPPPPVKPPEAKEVFLECKKLPGGFRIRPNPRATRPPVGFQLRAAYEVMRGNPFKLHHPADFDFTKERGSVRLETTGVTITTCETNCLVCSVDGTE